MAGKDIMTKKDLIAAIKECNVVLVLIRFGVNETWYKFAKKEAFAVAEKLADDADPDDYEMYCGRFGEVVEDTLYLG